MTDLDDVVTQLIQDQPEVHLPPLRQLRHRASARRRKWVAAAAVPALLLPALAIAVDARDAPGELDIASSQGPLREHVIRIEACPRGAPRPDLVCGSTQDPNEIERLTELLNRAQAVGEPPCQRDQSAQVSVVFQHAIEATPVTVYEPECPVIDITGDHPRMSEEFVTQARALMQPQTQVSSRKAGCLGLVEDLDELARGLDNWPPLDRDMQDNVSRLEARVANVRHTLTPEQRSVTEPLKGAYGNGGVLNSLLLGAPADADARLRRVLQELRDLCP
jgi:hypothetical protein